MAYTFDEQTVSDLHKDCYGFRPNAAFWEEWQSADADQKQQTWNQLVQGVENSILAEKQAEAEAIRNFETQISQNQALGAATRQDAIRWIVQSLEVTANNDPGYICYKLGLPYAMSQIFVDAGVTA